MENNDNKSIKNIIMLILGIVLVVVSIWGITGQLFLGTLLTNSLAYLLGIFYPAIFVLLFVIGLRMIIKRKLFPFKGYSFIYLGIFLLILSLCAIASVNMCDEEISLNTFNTFYQNKMNAFTSDFLQVPAFIEIFSLKGGYIGLLINVLLYSLWTKVGNIIFFSLLLIASLFFIFFVPVTEMIYKFKSIKADYRKNHPLREVVTDTIERPVPTVKEETVEVVKTKTVQSGTLTDFTFDGTKANSFKTYKPTSSLSQFKPVTTKTEASEARPVTPVEIKPVVNEKPVNQYSSFSNPVKPVVSNLTKPVINETSNLQHEEKPASEVKPTTDNNQEIVKPIVEETIEIKPIVINETKPDVVDEENSVENNIIEEDTFNPEDDFESTVSKPENNTFKQVVPQPYQVTGIENNFSPNIPVKPVQTSGNNGINNVYFVGSNNQSGTLNTPTAPASSDTKDTKKQQEELERAKEMEYFERKQKKMADEMAAKELEKKTRLANLMRFVTSRPIDYQYQLPGLELLRESDQGDKQNINIDAARSKIQTLDNTFAAYGIRAKVISFVPGASVTRFNIEIERGEKAEKLNSIVDDLRRELNGDRTVRVETVVEGQPYSGIEVKNKVPIIVSFKEVFSFILNCGDKNRLLLPIGKDISGNILTYALDAMPHLLVGGTTKSGKSVFIHSLILTLMMRNYPNQLKFVLIDPKKVEFVRYAEASHLFCPIVSKPEGAVLALKKLCGEMDKRYEAFAKLGCRDFDSYQEMRKGNSSLKEYPNIVVVIDEFADLMQTSSGEVAKSVQRLTQMGRACGIHLIIATQRPTKDCLPTTVKGNTTCRVALSVANGVDSRIVLDEVGAENLIGHGDLLFKATDRKYITRAQSAFVSEEEISDIVSYIKSNAGDPVYDADYLDLDEEAQSMDSENTDNKANPESQYLEIKDFVISTGITSKASIMRNFQVSSPKADQHLLRLLTERIVLKGIDGRYVINPSIVKKENY